MTRTDPSPQRRVPMTIRVILVLSLGLNLLVIGAVAGAWMRWGGFDGDLRAARAMGPVLYHELPRDARRELRTSLRSRLNGDAMRGARIGPELGAAIRAEPFDGARLREITDRQAAALQAGQVAMRDSWLAILSEMSPQDRSAYADRVSEALRRHSRFGGGHRP